MHLDDNSNITAITVAVTYAVDEQSRPQQDFIDEWTDRWYDAHRRHYSLVKEDIPPSWEEV